MERAETAAALLAAFSGVRSLAKLDEFSHAIWAEWGAGRLTDEQVSSLAEGIQARRREVRGVDTVAVRAPAVAAAAKAQGRASHFPPKRKAPVSPNRRLSIERRRRLAASGPMPPALACMFTTGELAALRIVADEARDRGFCALTLGEIAGRAGIGITTARNALRYAAGQGLVTIEERRRDKRPNLPNVVRIVSREWVNWIKRGTASRGANLSKGGGSKKMESTDKASFRSKCGAPFRRAFASNAPAIPPKSASRTLASLAPPLAVASGDP